MRLLVLLSLLVCLISSKACRVTKSNSAWKHAGGSFRRKSSGSLEWIEYDGEGKAQSEFVEETREGDQLVITSHQRGISILLRHDLAGIRNRGEHQFQQLYQGHWMRVADCT